MKWSLRIGRLAGIDVYVHATFALLLAWVALVDYRLTGTVLGAVSGVAFILAIFAIVVLHELGHALAARRYGIPTRDITLLPIGGVARLERMPRDPRQELVIALAGPAVNVALAFVLWILLRNVIADPLPEEGLIGSAGFGPLFLVRMFWVNVVLAAFNMIPAFPMDGGRVLRAILAMRRPYEQATATAARVGKFFAVLFGILGLFWLDNPFLVFIALFIWLGAAGEAAAERRTVALEGVPVGRVMITQFRTLSPSDPLSVAVRHVLDGFQQDFPVVDDAGAVVGVLTRKALIRALGAGPRDQRVADVMDRTFVTADPAESVDAALQRLRTCDCHAVPVVRERQLYGMVTLENVGEWVALLR